MRKFKIIDYSNLPEYLARQEELTDRNYGKFKRLHEELVSLVNKHTLPIPHGDGSYVPATPKVDPSGKQEIEQAEKELVLFCESLRSQMDNVIKAHPDKEILSKVDSVRLAYTLMTDSNPLTINYKQ